MQTFSGNPNGLKFDVFLGHLFRTVSRFCWSQDKCLHRIYDCLTDQALEYAIRLLISMTVGPYELYGGTIRLQGRANGSTPKAHHD